MGDYRKIAETEQVEFCHTPLICDGEGLIQCRTVYESQCQTRYHEHDVEDDVVECETVQEEKCEDVTQGYTTEKKCTKWPKQVCKSDKKAVKKYSPETECKKVPKELCGPSGLIWCPAQRSASPRLRLLFLKCQRRPATWSPKRSASTSPSWCPCSSPLRSASTSPRRSAPGPAPTPGRSRSQWSRSGVMSLLPSLVWPNLALFAIQLLLLMEHSLSLNPALLKFLQLFCYLDTPKIWIFQFYKFQITFVVLSYPKKLLSNI